jgi:D-lactate dehydrogenase (cytochrome)
MQSNPDVVVAPNSEAEIIEIVRIARENKIPIIPYGSGISLSSSLRCTLCSRARAGTSLEGHTSALFGGICVSLAQMNKIVAINEKDQDVIVQPGKLYANSHAKVIRTIE